MLRHLALLSPLVSDTDMKASHTQFVCFLGLYLMTIIANSFWGRFAKLPDVSKK